MYVVVFLLECKKFYKFYTFCTSMSNKLPPGFYLVAVKATSISQSVPQNQKRLEIRSKCIL